jgi:threonine 3-dehydrogenase
MHAVVKLALEPGVEVSDSVDEKACAPGDVRVTIAAASVCGTDRELVEYSSAAQAFNVVAPLVLGHECSGTVVELGAGVSPELMGARVALESHIPCGRCKRCVVGDAHNCEHLQILGIHRDGVFAESVVVPASICFVLPDAISFEAGALMESAGVALHGIQRYGRSLLGARVLITGGGPVGLVLAKLAILGGASHVAVVEPNDYRRQLAVDAGASGFSPSDLSDDEAPFDVGFDASGSPLAITSLLERVDREGTVITIGHPGQPVALDVSKYINKKGITLRGVFGRRLWDTWHQLSALLVSGSLDLESLVTHRLLLSDFPEAIDLLKGESCKVLLLPGRRVDA